MKTYSSKMKVKLPSGAKAGDYSSEPCIFKIKEGKFNTKNFKAEFGTLVVPENRQNPDSRLIAIPVLRVFANSNNPLEPIFHMEGGPGSSNMEFVPPAWMLEKHDYVLVGYRGADGSSILHCPEVSKAMRGTGNNLLSKESLENIQIAVKNDVNKFQNLGVDLAGYTITEVIEDFELARESLGYKKINLLSESYGTRVALIYSWMYPDSLLRSAMIGVNPPGRFIFEPDTIDFLLNRYADLWKENPEQVKKSPDLLKTIKTVLEHMPKRWLFIPIDKGKVLLTMFSLLYHTKTAAQLFDIFIAAEKGDASGLAALSLAYNPIFPGMITWGDMFAKGYCVDYKPGRDYFTTLNPPDSIMGSPLGTLLWESGSQFWPHNLIPEEYRNIQPSHTETLLISGNVDFSTPSENAANELMPYLTNGKQIIMKDAGHCNDSWNFDPPAFEQLLTSFFANGEADETLFSYKPMDFHVSFGFPKITKLLTGIAAVLGLGIIGLIVSLLI